MTEHKDTQSKAEQTITDELAQQPKNNQDTEATESSKLRRSNAEKELNDAKQPQGSTKS